MLQFKFSFTVIVKVGCDMTISMLVLQSFKVLFAISWVVYIHLIP